MIPLFLIFLTGLFRPASPEYPMCTYVTGWFPMRGESNDFYLARATNDSVFVRDLYWGSKGLFTTKQLPHDEKISLYGQILEVIQPGYEASPKTAVGEKVVLIWWSYGPGCEIVPTRRALGATPGSQLFVNLTPLPRPSWINGMKSYDVEGQLTGTASLYSLEFVAAPNMAQGDTTFTVRMTAAEFMKMYRVLTPHGSSTEAGMQQFLLWAKDNPQLARKYPACAMLHLSEANLTPRSRRPMDASCR